ncbi:MAG TPA: TadE/TadG family type IV pilus assembly protein [Mycobacteriales bacterium]|nr:TadE/TadG family type IV pilus assembly protein [Mycobacteriales bacterium]
MRWRWRAVTGSADRGSFSLELVVLAPVLLLVVAFIVSVGRITEGRAMVEGAVRDAARAATINHNGNAEAAARAAYSAATQGRHCGQLELTPTVPQPGGSVRATATCQVRTIWGTRPITRTSVSAVDLYRGTD